MVKIFRGGDELGGGGYGIAYSNTVNENHIPKIYRSLVDQKNKCINRENTPTLAIKVYSNDSSDVSQSMYYTDSPESPESPEIDTSEYDICQNIQTDLKKGKKFPTETLIFPTDIGLGFVKRDPDAVNNNTNVLVVDNNTDTYVIKPILVSPLAPGATLNNEIKKINNDADWLKFIDSFIKLVTDIKNLNDVGWNMLDIKGANMNYDNKSGIIKMFDFGLSQKNIYSQNPQELTYSAVYKYWPPELYIYNRKVNNKNVNLTIYVNKFIGELYELYPREKLLENQNQFDKYYEEYEKKFKDILSIDTNIHNIFDIRKFDTYSLGITGLDLLESLRDIYNIPDRDFYTKLFKKASEFNPQNRLTIDQLLDALKSHMKIIIPTRNGGTHHSKKSTKTATAERIEINGKKRVVYIGPKGGRYVKQNGVFIRV